MVRYRGTAWLPMLCRTSGAHKQDQSLIDTSELVCMPSLLCHRLKRNNMYQHIFSDLASKSKLPQSQGKNRDLGAVPSWQTCTSAVTLVWFIFKNNFLLYDISILQRKKKFTLGAGLGQSSERLAKIQSENSLAGSPQWLFPPQCQKNDKFTLTHSHRHKRKSERWKREQWKAHISSSV